MKSRGRGPRAVSPANDSKPRVYPTVHVARPFTLSQSKCNLPSSPRPQRSYLCALCVKDFSVGSYLIQQKKREPTSPPPLNRTAAIRYLWPECVIRAMMSRRLSGTVLPKNSARSAGLHLLIVVLMAVAHLSMPSALG